MLAGWLKKCPWKKNIARENSRIFGRETYFLPVKKTQNLAVKKKYVREKSEKNRKTRAWKSIFAREKIEKEPKKGLSRPLFFSRQKKKNTALDSMKKSKSSMCSPFDSPLTKFSDILFLAWDTLRSKSVDISTV